MSLILKAASAIKPGDKIVRTLNHDGSPKRTATVRGAKTSNNAHGAMRYMFTVEPAGDVLGWYSATYQFTVEV